MKAFILAAGKGERMRPLTDNLPKPLLKVGSKALIVHLLEKLISAGVKDFVINTAYLGHMLKREIGDGRKFGVAIRYSEEKQPLETGGAIHHALDILGDDPFLLVNSDIWTDYDFSALIKCATDTCAVRESGAHLVLVNNPRHNAEGDFCLDAGMLKKVKGTKSGYTFAGVSLISPELIKNFPDAREKFPLREVFSWGIDRGKVSGELHTGQWVDVGTPDRLNSIQRLIS